MSQRERWTVYPLLILALGASLKDKIAPPRRLDVSEIQCDVLVANAEVTTQRVQAVEAIQDRLKTAELQVIGSNGSVRALMKETKTGNGGGLQIYGDGNHPVLLAAADQEGHAGTLQLFTAEGQLRVALSTAESNGVISTFRDADELLVRTMFDRKGSGVVFTRDVDGKLRLLLGLPFTQEAPPHLNDSPTPPSEESDTQDPASETTENVSDEADEDAADAESSPADGE